MGDESGGVEVAAGNTSLIEQIGDGGLDTIAEKIGLSLNTDMKQIVAYLTSSIVLNGLQDLIFSGAVDIATVATSAGYGEDKRLWR